jgi:hypothetical protein
VQGKENTGSGHLRKLVGQATSTPAGRNTLTTVSGGFAVQLFLLVSGVVVARLLGVEDRGHLAFPRSPDPLLRTVSNK